METDEEAAEPKIRRAPKGSTKEERERHEATHLPFRDWCKHCLRGRGRNRPHQSRKGNAEESQVVRISMDYFFMSKEEEKASQNPLIVMVDESSDNRYSH